MSKKKLARNIGMMSIAVFFSRILGLVRDQVMAYFFGGGYLNDAFNVAYNIPNLLRRLFGEGALSTAFVPIYTRLGKEKSKEAQIDFALNLLSILSLILIGLTALGIIFAPLLVRLLYPGLSAQSTVVAIKLTRIIFPYLFFIGLSSTFIAILNSHDYFFMTGLSSALLNIGMILCIIVPYFIFKMEPEQLIYPAGWGVFIGGILQTVVNLPYLKKVGYRFKLILKFSGEALSTLWKRFIPGMIGIGIREINLVADALMASFLPIGSITALGYGNRLMQLPLGIFAISAGTAVLPMYSRLVGDRKYDELSSNLRFASLNLVYIMLPITALILALAPDFITILFGRGAFDDHAIWMSSQALIFYSMGLIFYSMNQVLTPIFYAQGDTKTPMILAGILVGLNITMNFILMQFIQHRGLALSTSLTALINYILLLSLIRKKYPQISYRGIAPNLIKSIALAAIIYLQARYLSSLLTYEGTLGLLLKVGIVSLIGFFSFYLLGIIFRLSFLKESSVNLWKRFRR